MALSLSTVSFAENTAPETVVVARVDANSVSVEVEVPIIPKEW